MSYMVAITIACDAEGCRKTITQTRINRGGLSKTWAGYLAAKDGWRIPGTQTHQDPKRAWCPEHAEPNR